MERGTYNDNHVDWSPMGEQSGAPCSGVDSSPAPSKVLAPNLPETSLVAPEVDPSRRTSREVGGFWGQPPVATPDVRLH